MSLVRRFRTLRLFATAAVALAATAVALSASTGGCGGSYRPDDATTGDDASVDSTTNESSTSDAGPDANACGADLQTDPKNCGRCGHDCLGGACGAGKCQAIELAAVSAPLAHALVSGSYVYVSTVKDKVD